MKTYQTFNELVEFFESHPGSFYERKKGLTPRCAHGHLWGDDFGTITYVTDDG